MKKLLFISLFLFVVLGCENSEDFDPSRLIDIINLEIENNGTTADGISKIKVIASFPKDFQTENDNKIDFVVFKDSIENSSQDLVFISQNGLDKKIAELFIANTREELIKVKAVAKINDAQISKEIELSFSRAYADSINVYTDSLTINSNSFKELRITTELIRKIGKVSLLSKADTKVIDTLGNERGLFNNYRNIADKNGQIINLFTLGNDDYIGKLFIISESNITLNEKKLDTTVIFSKN